MSSPPRQIGSDRPPVGDAGTPPRAPYSPPQLESLGRWSALTLQQSVPIGPNSLLLMELILMNGGDS